MADQQCPEHDFSLERVSRLTPALTEATGRLVPQLSPGRMPPSEAELSAMLRDDRTHLYVARTADGAIQGMLVIVFYRVPTGLHARIEDLVVSESHRGLGLGKALVLRAMQAAQEAQAHVLDLTSSPSRKEANALYLRLGFRRWETNVYRKVLDASG